MTEDLPEIPGYTIEHLLGEGGMARVYLAIQRGFERPVALKIIAPELAANEEFGKRFLREARIVGMLSHPHIVPVYDVGEHKGLLYLAMEILADGDLRSRMIKPLDEDVALEITRQLASALGYAHKKGFIHRDVKPDNVLFRDVDTAVLTDFGIARAAEDSEDVTQITQVQSVIGSPKYMSPEQSLGHQLDARTDIYSLGVMLFQMLSGDAPYSGRNLTEISLQRFERQMPRLPDHLQRLQPLIDSMMAYNRDQRFASCEDLLVALKDLPSGSPPVVAGGAFDATAVMAAPEVPPPQPREQAVGPGRRAVVFGAALVLCLSAAGGWYALRNNESVQVAKTAGTPVVLQEKGLAEAALEGEPPQDSVVTVRESGEATTLDKGVVADAVANDGDRSESASSLAAAPQSDTVPAAPVSPPLLPEPDEFFAFYDAVNLGVPAAEKEFVAAYPRSVFADILRVKSTGDMAAVEALQQQAASGSARAMSVLGELYDTGWVVGKDKDAALRYAELAARQGSPLGLYQHATLLMAVAQTDAQRRAALRILEKSAEDGFFLAQTLLANHLFDGRLLGRDVDESLRLFTLAGEQGDRNALFNLGRIYDAGIHLSEPDTARAREYFLAAARLGHPQARNYLQEPI
ncbi:MAG TPA: hypothetical protein DD808_02215 [Halieaceae bacterium]|jgi:hypothetical protein|uniref:serine/threonine-protein kinase n=1 Tax=Haliea TaxID=475794 RepID=UPI000C46C011|nr:serine/threonine-protein kinase [Haliea sp.]MAD64330.1 hypothetical protein [Haliea sp.]MAY93255.1 hypothetical protein [Haliea sp.]MBP71145.1 hypothetical protein [Haliea sp.]HBQ39379.1 hypothetical protein [Halieaceae bacterium]|tara:strand:+ start:1474 stop:3375 length:1902 start_codon:yes stop_codon:yes gene_type:complete